MKTIAFLLALFAGVSFAVEPMAQVLPIKVVVDVPVSDIDSMANYFDGYWTNGEYVSYMDGVPYGAIKKVESAADSAGDI